jgi:hypothetical protein
METAKLLASLFALTVLAALLAFAQVEYDSIEVSFGSTGTITVVHERLTKTTGHVYAWGPGWRWEESCSYQGSWAVQPWRSGTSEAEARFEGVFQCSFAKVSWKVRAWLGVDSFLIELNMTADEDSRFKAIAWDFELPINLFAGKNVTLLLSNNTEVPVVLRRNHVPAMPAINGSSYPNGVGWVIPYDGDRGLVVAVLGDTWPTGMNVVAVDNREWQGRTYSLRSWLFIDDFQMPKGVIVRLLVYVHPYSSRDELEVGLSRVREAVRMLQGGESSDAVKSFIISAMNLEEAAAARKARGPPLMLTVTLTAYAIIAAIAATIIIFALPKRKGRALAVTRS